MCLNPITITTRSRYISLLYQQPFVLQVPCNHCAECLSAKRNEWHFRIYHEWLETYRKGGYVLFDTLTYSDEHLPTICKMLPGYNFESDHSCFSRSDINGFFHRLRRRLSYYGKDVAGKLRYFVAAEYGADDRYTHRPHYHVLFFVTSDKLSVFDLKSAIRYSWYFGRVDSLRLSGKKSNYFPCVNLPNLGLSNYVAKYVQKDSSFQSTIEFRISQALDSYINDFASICEPLRLSVNPDDVSDSIYSIYFPAFFAREGVRFTNDDSCLSILKSYKFKQFHRSLVRTVDQFHVQSHGFGLSALKYFSIEDIMRNGYFTMPDKDLIVRKVPLSRYYKSHLFYSKCVVNGQKMRCLNSLGSRFRSISESRYFDKLVSSYYAYEKTFNCRIPCDIDDLARYVIYRRGRINGDIPFVPTQEYIYNNCSNLIFNYSSPSDSSKFGSKLVSFKKGHFSNIFATNLESCISVDYFISRFVFFDPFYEEILYKIDLSKLRHVVSKQRLFDMTFDYRNRLSGVLF